MINGSWFREGGEEERYCVGAHKEATASVFDAVQETIERVYKGRDIECVM